MSDLSKLSLTVFPNGIASFLVDTQAEIKTAAYQVVATTDSGKTFISTTAGVVFTLPVFSTGQVFTFVNMAKDGLNNLTITPSGSDVISYVGGLGGADSLVNTLATSQLGDQVTIASLTGTGWEVTWIRGIWAKVA